MDLNHVLVWLSGLTVISWLVALLRDHGRRATSWIITTGAILGLWLAGVFAWPDLAGYVTAGAWVLFLLAPMLGLRAMQALVLRGRYGAALWVARLVAALHPSAGHRAQPQVLSILALQQRGELDRADAAIEALRQRAPGLVALARLTGLRARARWEELVAQVDARPDRDAFLLDEASAGLYLRALGELGRVPELLAGYVQLVHPRNPAGRANHQIYIAALTGQVELVRTLLAGPLAVYGPELGAFWEGTALQAAGDHAAAEALLRPLVTARDFLIRSGAQRRLEQPRPSVDLEALPAEARAVLTMIDAAVTRSVAAAAQARAAAVTPKMTYALLAVMGAVFLAELPGGSEDAGNLYELGALVGPVAQLDGEWWRLVTAGFLHFGWLHLALNGLGIALFGRSLERALGPWRFAAVFLISSVGALAIMLAWSELVTGEPFMLVGASASLMGIVGATVAVTLRRVLRGNMEADRRLLVSLAVVLVVQTAFDLTTPRVSVGAHLGGALLGLVLGLVLAPSSSYDLARAAKATGSDP